MNLQPEIAIAVATAVTPFLAVGGLLWLSRRAGLRRSADITRQIALTDEIHRELGAAAAPEVRRGWQGAWTVAMAVPLEREATVGALVRIAHEVFARLDDADAPRLRIVLTPQERRPRRLAAPTTAPGRADRRLGRAVPRLG